MPIVKSLPMNKTVAKNRLTSAKKDLEEIQSKYKSLVSSTKPLYTTLHSNTPKTLANRTTKHFLELKKYKQMLNTAKKTVKRAEKTVKASVKHIPAEQNSFFSATTLNPLKARATRKNRRN